jgi:hypothetical protein
MHLIEIFACQIVSFEGDVEDRVDVLLHVRREKEIKERREDENKDEIKETIKNYTRIERKIT